MSTLKNYDKTEIPLSGLQAQIGVINRQVVITRKHIILTSKNFPVAAIVPISDYNEKFKAKIKK